MEARINEEAERATHYLDETTEPRIVEVDISFENIDIFSDLVVGDQWLNHFTLGLAQLIQYMFTSHLKGC